MYTQVQRAWNSQENLEGKEYKVAGLTLARFKSDNKATVRERSQNEARTDPSTFNPPHFLTKAPKQFDGRRNIFLTQLHIAMGKN